MLELSHWFFVQLFNFLVLIILLNIILFKPLLSLFKERDNRTSGFIEQAKAMDKEKDNLLSQMEAKLSEARNQARWVFEELRNDGMAIQKQALDSAKKDAGGTVQKARDDLETTVKKARESLRRDVEVFSKKIVEKMVRV